MSRRIWEFGSAAGRHKQKPDREDATTAKKATKAQREHEQR